MTLGEETVRALREALGISPDNAPLRRHLADTLAALGRYDEALEEYRIALAGPGDRAAVKLAMARTYFAKGNIATAFEVVEDLLKQPNVWPEARLLYCRLLLAKGQDQRAALAYRRAIDADPSLADADLAAQLQFDHNSEGGDQSDADEVDESGRIRLPRADADGKTFDTALERPRISFKDVGGMEALKDEIRMKIIHPLTHRDLYKAYGKSIGGGILMYGPPGCGKTYLARATAGEVKASFLAVGINDVLDMWMGNSEKNLHDLFDMARRNTPCVLFFDEVDALGASRTDMRTSSVKQVINLFLNELDGAKSSNEGILVLGATNAPWHLDSAFRRPGRFDRVLFVPPPDAPARQDILAILLRGKPAAGVDVEALASKAEEFSGADLKAVVDIAIEAKLREAMKKGLPLPLTTKDLLASIKTLKPTTKEWFATARNYALYANQGGIYDDILTWLEIK